MPKPPHLSAPPQGDAHPHQYRLAAATIATLSIVDVARHGLALPPTDARSLAAIQPETLMLDYGTFTSLPLPGGMQFPTVVVEQQGPDLLLSCACSAPKTVLCEHQALVLLAILQRPELRVFFDPQQRHELLKAQARDYGLEHSPNLDAHFQLTYARPTVLVTPRQAGLYPITAAAKQALVSELLPAPAAPPRPTAGQQRLVVLSKHKYYGHLTLQLAEAALTAAGKVKNPVSVLNPLDELGPVDDVATLKFYTGLARFQHNYDESRSAAAVTALRAIVLNPLSLPFFGHTPAGSDKLSGPTLMPLELRLAPAELRLHVSQEGEFFEVAGQLLLHGQPVDLKALALRYEYFVVVQEVLYLVEDLAVWRVIDFFRKRNNTLLIHASKFAEFQREVLANLENQLHINYSYLRPATRRQQVANGFDQPPARLLYLSDAGPLVELLPVLRYGNREVAILSRRQVLATDERGRAFVLARDAEAEARLTTPASRSSWRSRPSTSPKPYFCRRNGFWRPSRIGINQALKSWASISLKTTP
jgi:hypothetical protein